MQVWGRAWLERGVGEARFAKPVYEGDLAEVSAVAEGDGLALTVHSAGVLCATGRAGLPSGPGAAPLLGDYKAVPPRGDRVAADEASLRVGDWLGMEPFHVAPDWHAQDLIDIRETDPIYAREGIVHTGTVLRCCNWVLMHNVLLPTWIHVGSTVRNLGVAHVGDTLNVRARVTKSICSTPNQVVF